VPRPREYDDQLRLRLIEEAARLLADEGPAAVTTRRVATAVGTSTTAIYSLIGSKEDLIQAVRAEGFDRLAVHLATVEPTDDPIADLTRLAIAYFDMGVESPALYRVMFGQGIFGGCAPEITAEDTEDTRPGIATLITLVDAVQRAIDAGLLPGDADLPGRAPFALALQLWSLGHGVTSLALTGMLGPPAGARAVLERAEAAMLSGMRVATATPAEP
jgi:AcrR family transcriptional regulator